MSKFRTVEESSRVWFGDLGNATAHWANTAWDRELERVEDAAAFRAAVDTDHVPQAVQS